MRPRARSCPGCGAGQSELRWEGPANGSREVAGAIAEPRKSRSRAQHTFQCKQGEILQSLPSPGQSAGECSPNSAALPTLERNPARRRAGRLGHPASKSRPWTQLLTAPKAAGRPP